MRILELFRRALAAISALSDRCWRCRRETSVPGDMVTGLVLCPDCRAAD